MLTKQESQVARVLIVVVIGISMFLMCTLVWTRLTVVDPFLPLSRGSRAIANTLALVHFLGVLALWSGAVRTFTRTEAIATVIVAVVSLAAFWLASAMVDTRLADVVRLYVGRHAWWVLPIVGGSLLPLAGTRVKSASAASWTSLWGVGTVAFALGVALYLVGPDVPVSMFAKVMLILVVPSVVLVATAVRYRGSHALLWRSAGALGAMIGAAVATIR